MRAKALSLFLVLALPAACLAAAPADENAVEQANAQFYASLNALFTGDVAPMREIWSHADDVTYLGPAGGFQVGWRQVDARWEAQAALKLGGKIAAEQAHTTVGADLAVVHCYERGENFDEKGKPVKVSIRATNVFRKENGQWKMIGHHTDLLPFLTEETRTASVEPSLE